VGARVGVSRINLKVVQSDSDKIIWTNNFGIVEGRHRLLRMIIIIRMVTDCAEFPDEMHVGKYFVRGAAMLTGTPLRTVRERNCAIQIDIYLQILHPYGQVYTGLCLRQFPGYLHAVARNCGGELIIAAINDSPFRMRCRTSECSGR